MAGCWPDDNEGAQALIEFFKKETASRPAMMEPISIGFIGKHLNEIHGPDGTFDNKKGPFIEGKYESVTPKEEKLMGRQSWGVTKTKGLSRIENIKKKLKKIDFLQIGSYTNDLRLIALFDMPIRDTNVEKDLIDKSKNTSNLKLSYKSIDTPKAIKNSCINCIDLDLAKKYCTKGYYNFLKKLNQKLDEEMAELDNA